MIKAHAIMEGRVIADISDLEILKDVLWEEPGQKKDVAAVVRKFSVDTVTAEIQDIMAEAQEIRKMRLTMDRLLLAKRPIRSSNNYPVN